MADDETLESGYGAATPPGDNLCNDFQRETAASFLAIALARGDRVEQVPGVITMTDAQAALPFWNRAVLEAPATDLGELLRTARAFYDGHSNMPFLLDSAWPTPDLRPQGFSLMGYPPLMLRTTNDPPPPPPPELRIEQVLDERGAEDLERTLVEGYPAPQLQPFEKVTLFTPGTFEAPGWSHFVGYVDDQPVAAGSSYTGERLVRVENIATLPSARGKGYGAAITAATFSIAPDLPAVLVASDLGRPVYERLGFDAMLRVTYWVGSR